MKKHEHPAIKKTTLRLSFELWRAAHIRALDEGLSLEGLIKLALERYLKEAR
jgi:predicted HicB family RNase H-like nuclease